MNDVLFSPIRLDELEILIEKSIRRAIAADPKPETSQLLTVEQAAEFLSVTKATIYFKTHMREIPFMKRGKRIYFSRQELISYLQAGRQMTNAEIAANPDEFLKAPKRKAK